MALKEIRRGEYVETKELEDPKCVRAEQFEEGRFADYILSRLEHARDEASVQVLKQYKAKRSLGDAVLDVIEALPAAKTRRLRKWVEEAKGTHIYAYVEFPSTELVTYGIKMTKGGPTDEVLSAAEVGHYGVEDLAPYYIDVNDAIHDIEQIVPQGGPVSMRGGGSLYLTEQMEQESEASQRARANKVMSLFENVPAVQVDNKTQYDSLIAAMRIAPEEGKYTKPGLYWMRDVPPEYHSTVDEYEREAMKEEAGNALDLLFQEPWEDECDTLVEKSRR